MDQSTLKKIKNSQNKLLDTMMKALKVTKQELELLIEFAFGNSLCTKKINKLINKIGYMDLDNENVRVKLYKYFVEFYKYRPIKSEETFILKKEYYRLIKRLEKVSQENVYMYIRSIVYQNILYTKADEVGISYMDLFYTPKFIDDFYRANIEPIIDKKVLEFDNVIVLNYFPCGLASLIFKEAEKKGLGVVYYNNKSVFSDNITTIENGIFIIDSSDPTYVLDFLRKDVEGDLNIKHSNNWIYVLLKNEKITRASEGILNVNDARKPNTGNITRLYDISLDIKEHNDWGIHHDYIGYIINNFNKQYELKPIDWNSDLNNPLEHKLVLPNLSKGQKYKNFIDETFVSSFKSSYYDSENILEDISKTIYNKFSYENNRTPLTILFSGLPGMGKTEFVQVASEIFYGIDPYIININNIHDEKELISELLGSSYGYVGSDLVPRFLEYIKTHEKEGGFILIDECDKTSPASKSRVLDTFLNMLSSGYVIAKGATHKYNLSKFIFVFSGNYMGSSESDDIINIDNMSNSLKSRIDNNQWIFNHKIETKEIIKVLFYNIIRKVLISISSGFVFKLNFDEKIIDSIIADINDKYTDCSGRTIFNFIDVNFAILFQKIYYLVQKLYIEKDILNIEIDITSESVGIDIKIKEKV